MCTWISHTGSIRLKLSRVRKLSRCHLTGNNDEARPVTLLCRARHDACLRSELALDNLGRTLSILRDGLTDMQGMPCMFDETRC
eukprot:6083021-Pleurochrysis_carterae.AAC.1